MNEDLLRREVQQLKELLTYVNNRLRQLESRIGAQPTPTAPPAAEPPHSAPTAVSQPAAVASPSVQQLPTPSAAAPTIPSADPARPLVEATTARAERCRAHPKQMVRWSCATCQAPLCELCGGVAFRGQVSCKRCDAAHGTKPAKSAAPQGRETLETRIGRDWLNRIGITSLVLGVAFFILYSFQYLGPAAKLAIGAAIAGGLLGAGIWLERRAPFRWVARGLIGGGWAILYFTTYAMHHIQAVRVLDSALVDLVLLAFVATGAIWHSLAYRSQTVTSLALLLGFLTIFVSHVTYFTLIASALLVVALAWLVVRMRWDELYVYGVITSYVTHLFWVHQQIALSPMLAVQVANAAQAQFWLNVSFVSLYWIVYNVALFALDEQTPTRRNRLLTATLVNSLLCVSIVLTDMAHVFRESRYLVLLGFGAVYGLSEILARRRQLPTIATVHLLLGLIFLTLAIPLKFTGRWLSFLWTAEVALLVWVGLRYARWPYRFFAMVWTLIIFSRLVLMDLWTVQTILVWHWMVPWRVLMGGFGIAAFGLAAWWYRQPRFTSVLRPAESPAFHLYFTAAAILVWLLTGLEVPGRWIVVALAIEAAGSVLLGFRLADHFIRVLGAAGFGLVGFRLLGSIGTWDPWAVSIIVGLLYGMSWCYRSVLGRRAGIGPRPQHAYAVAASVLLTMLLHAKIHNEWLSVAWAVEIGALVVAGFLLKDRVLRMSGLGVCALLVMMLTSDWYGALWGSQGTPQWTLSTTPWVIGILYAMGRLYRRKAEDVGPAECNLAELYSIAASIALTVLLWLEVPSKWLSVAWAAEGLALVAVGFGLRDKTLRVSGLCVFGLLVLKILFHDLAGAETIYRILSFIAAGALLLVASFVYAKYTERAPKSDT